MNFEIIGLWNDQGSRTIKSDRTIIAMSPDEAAEVFFRSNCDYKLTSGDKVTYFIQFQSETRVFTYQATKLTSRHTLEQLNKLVEAARKPHQNEYEIHDRMDHDFDRLMPKHKVNMAPIKAWIEHLTDKQLSKPSDFLLTPYMKRFVSVNHADLHAVLNHRHRHSLNVRAANRIIEESLHTWRSSRRQYIPLKALNSQWTFLYTFYLVATTFLHQYATIPEPHWPWDSHSGPRRHSSAYPIRRDRTTVDLHELNRELFSAALEPYHY